MKPHDPFETEEFSRYGAECRRLARLARPPERRPATLAAFAARLASTDGLAHLRALAPHFTGPHRPQFAAAAMRR